MIADKLIVFDLETGGLEVGRPITQIAAVAVNVADGWRELEAFEAKLQFSQEDADPRALEITSYDPGVWERDAVHPSAAASNFTLFLERYRCVTCISKKGNPYQVAQLCGHNAAAFDGPHLKHLYGETLREPGAKYGPFLPAHPFVLDTWQLAGWYFQACGITPPADFKLSTLCDNFDIPLEDAHDALADVRATAWLAQELSNALNGGHP